MIRRTLLALAAFLAYAILTSGCASRSLAPFTEEAFSIYNLGKEDLEKIQFYISHTVVLTTVSETKESSISMTNRILLRDATYIDKIIIKRKTPGIITRKGLYYLEVSFEPDLSLRFGAMNNGTYALEGTTVRYGDQDYEVECVEHKARRCPPILLVRSDVKAETITQKREVPGRSIQ